MRDFKIAHGTLDQQIHAREPASPAGANASQGGDGRGGDRQARLSATGPRPVARVRRADAACSGLGIASGPTLLPSRRTGTKRLIPFPGLLLWPPDSPKRFALGAVNPRPTAA